MRETRHLWVGNIPDNTREEKITEYFKRYGRIEKVKILSKRSSEGELQAVVAFVDLRSSQKAHNAVNTIGENQLQTNFSEPAAMSVATSRHDSASPASSSRYSQSSSSHRGYSSTHRNDTKVSDSHASDKTQHSERHRSNQGSADSSRNTEVSDTKSSAKVNHKEQRLSEGGTAKTTQKKAKGENTKGKKKSKKTEEQPKTAGKDTKHKTGRGRSPTVKKKSANRKQKKQEGSSSEEDVRSSSSNSSMTTGRSSSGSTGSSSMTSRSNSTCSSSRRSTTAESEPEGGQKLVTMIIKKLPARPSVNSLREGIYHEFKKCGKVKSVLIRGDNNNRHALVLFRNASEANKAVTHGKSKLLFGAAIDAAIYEGEVSGKELQECGGIIDEFHPRASRTLFVGNLDKTVGYSDIQNIFVRFGEIVAIEIKRQNNVPQYAFLQYTDIASVVKAIQKMDGEKLGKNTLKLGFGKTVISSCLWVEGVTDSFTEHYLATYFQKHGPVEYVVIDRNRGQALVFYLKHEHAQQALTNLRGRKMNGSRLKLDYASHTLIELFLNEMQTSGQKAPTFESIRHLILAAPATSNPAPSPTTPNPRGSSSRSSGSVHPVGFTPGPVPSFERFPPGHPAYDIAAPPARTADWRAWEERNRGRPVFSNVSPRGRRGFEEDRPERPEYYRDEEYLSERLPPAYESVLPEYPRREHSRDYAGGAPLRGYPDDYHRALKPRDRRDPLFHSRRSPGRLVRRSRSNSPRSVSNRRGRIREFDPKVEPRLHEHRDVVIPRGRSPVCSPGPREERGSGSDSFPLRKYRQDHRYGSPGHYFSPPPRRQPSPYNRRGDERRVELRGPPDSPRSGSIRSKVVQDALSPHWSNSDAKSSVETRESWPTSHGSYDRSRSETPTRDENLDSIGEIIIKQPTVSSVVTAKTTKHEMSRQKSVDTASSKTDVSVKSQVSSRASSVQSDKDANSGRAKLESTVSVKSSSSNLLQRVHSESPKRDSSSKTSARANKDKVSIAKQRKKAKKIPSDSDSDQLSRKKRALKDKERLAKSKKDASLSSQQQHHERNKLIKREYSPSHDRRPADTEHRRSTSLEEKPVKSHHKATRRPSNSEDRSNSDRDQSNSGSKKRRYSEAHSTDSGAVHASSKDRRESHDHADSHVASNEAESHTKASKRARKTSHKHDAPMSIASQSFMDENVEDDMAVDSEAERKQPSSLFRHKPVKEEPLSPEISDLKLLQEPDEDVQVKDEVVQVEIPEEQVKLSPVKTELLEKEPHEVEDSKPAVEDVKPIVSAYEPYFTTIASATALKPTHLPKPKVQPEVLPSSKDIPDKPVSNLTELEKEKIRLQQLLSKLDSEQKLEVNEASEVADIFFSGISNKLKKPLAKEDAVEVKTEGKSTPVETPQSENTAEEAKYLKPQVVSEAVPDQIASSEETPADPDPIVEEQIIESVVEEEITTFDEVITEVTEVESTAEDLVSASKKPESVDLSKSLRKQMEAQRQKDARRKEKEVKSLLKRQHKDLVKHKRHVEQMRGPMQGIISAVDDLEEEDEKEEVGPPKVVEKTEDTTAAIDNAPVAVKTEKTPENEDKVTEDNKPVEVSPLPKEVEDKPAVKQLTESRETTPTSSVAKSDVASPNVTIRSAPGSDRSSSQSQDALIMAPPTSNKTPLSASPYTPKSASSLGKQSQNSHRSNSSSNNTPSPSQARNKVHQHSSDQHKKPSSSHRHAEKHSQRYHPGKHHASDPKRRKVEGGSKGKHHSQHELAKKTPKLPKPITSLTVALNVDPSEPLGKKELETLKAELENMKNQLSFDMSPSFLSPSSEEEAVDSIPMSPILKSPMAERFTSGETCDRPTNLMTTAFGTSSSRTERLKQLGRVKKKTLEDVTHVTPKEAEKIREMKRKLEQQRSLEFCHSRLLRSSIFDQDSARLSHLQQKEEEVETNKDADPPQISSPLFSSLVDASITEVPYQPKAIPGYLATGTNAASTVVTENNFAAPKNEFPLSSIDALPAPVESRLEEIDAGCSELIKQDVAMRGEEEVALAHVTVDQKFGKEDAVERFQQEDNAGPTAVVQDTQHDADVEISHTLTVDNQESCGTSKVAHVETAEVQTPLASSEIACEVQSEPSAVEDAHLEIECRDDLAKTSLILDATETSPEDEGSNVNESSVRKEEILVANISKEEEAKTGETIPDDRAAKEPDDVEENVAVDTSLNVVEEYQVDDPLTIFEEEETISSDIQDNKIEVPEVEEVAVVTLHSESESLDDNQAEVPQETKASQENKEILCVSSSELELQTVMQQVAEEEISGQIVDDVEDDIFDDVPLVIQENVETTEIKIKQEFGKASDLDVAPSEIVKSHKSETERLKEEKVKSRSDKEKSVTKRCAEEQPEAPHFKESKKKSSHLKEDEAESRLKESKRKLHSEEKKSEVSHHRDDKPDREKKVPSAYPKAQKSEQSPVIKKINPTATSVEGERSSRDEHKKEVSISKKSKYVDKKSSKSDTVKSESKKSHKKSSKDTSLVSKSLKHADSTDKRQKHSSDGERSKSKKSHKHDKHKPDADRNSKDTKNSAEKRAPKSESSSREREKSVKSDLKSRESSRDNERPSVSESNTPLKDSSSKSASKDMKHGKITSGQDSHKKEKVKSNSSKHDRHKSEKKKMKHSDEKKSSHKSSKESSEQKKTKQEEPRIDKTTSSKTKPMAKITASDKFGESFKSFSGKKDKHKAPSSKKDEEGHSEKSKHSSKLKQHKTSVDSDLQAKKRPRLDDVKRSHGQSTSHKEQDSKHNAPGVDSILDATSSSSKKSKSKVNRPQAKISSVISSDSDSEDSKPRLKPKSTKYSDTQQKKASLVKSRPSNVSSDSESSDNFDSFISNLSRPTQKKASKFDNIYSSSDDSNSAVESNVTEPEKTEKPVEHLPEKVKKADVQQDSDHSDKVVTKKLSSKSSTKDHSVSKKKDSKEKSKEKHKSEDPKRSKPEKKKIKKLKKRHRETEDSKTPLKEKSSSKHVIKDDSDSDAAPSYSKKKKDVKDRSALPTKSEKIQENVKEKQVARPKLSSESSLDSNDYPSSPPSTVLTTETIRMETSYHADYKEKFSSKLQPPRGSMAADQPSLSTDSKPKVASQTEHIYSSSSSEFSSDAELDVRPPAAEPTCGEMLNKQEKQLLLDMGFSSSDESAVEVEKKPVFVPEEKAKPKHSTHESKQAKHPQKHSKLSQKSQATEGKVHIKKHQEAKPSKGKSSDSSSHPKHESLKVEKKSKSWFDKSPKGKEESHSTVDKEHQRSGKTTELPRHEKKKISSKSSSDKHQKHEKPTSVKSEEKPVARQGDNAKKSSGKSQKAPKPFKSDTSLSHEQKSDDPAAKQRKHSSDRHRENLKSKHKTASSPKHHADIRSVRKERPSSKLVTKSESESQHALKAVSKPLEISKTHLKADEEKAELSAVKKSVKVPEKEKHVIEKSKVVDTKLPDDVEDKTVTETESVDSDVSLPGSSFFSAPEKIQVEEEKPPPIEAEETQPIVPDVEVEAASPLVEEQPPVSPPPLEEEDRSIFSPSTSLDADDGSRIKQEESSFAVDSKAPEGDFTEPNMITPPKEVKPSQTKEVKTSIEVKKPLEISTTKQRQRSKSRDLSPAESRQLALTALERFQSEHERKIKNIERLKKLSRQRDEEAVRSIMGEDESDEMLSSSSDVDFTRLSKSYSDTESTTDSMFQAQTTKEPEVVVPPPAQTASDAEQQEQLERSKAEEQELAAAVSSIEGLFGDFDSSKSEDLTPAAPSFPTFESPIKAPESQPEESFKESPEVLQQNKEVGSSKPDKPESVLEKPPVQSNRSLSFSSPSPVAETRKSVESLPKVPERKIAEPTQQKKVAEIKPFYQEKKSPERAPIVPVKVTPEKTIQSPFRNVHKPSPITIPTIPTMPTISPAEPALSQKIPVPSPDHPQQQQTPQAPPVTPKAPAPALHETGRPFLPFSTPKQAGPQSSPKEPKHSPQLGLHSELPQALPAPSRRPSKDHHAVPTGERKAPGFGPVHVQASPKQTPGNYPKHAGRSPIVEPFGVPGTPPHRQQSPQGASPGYPTHAAPSSNKASPQLSSPTASTFKFPSSPQHRPTSNPSPFAYAHSKAAAHLSPQQHVATFPHPSTAVSSSVDSSPSPKTTPTQVQPPAVSPLSRTPSLPPHLTSPKTPQTPTLTSPSLGPTAHLMSPQQLPPTQSVAPTPAYSSQYAARGPVSQPVVATSTPIRTQVLDSAPKESPKAPTLPHSAPVTQPTSRPGGASYPLPYPTQPSPGAANNPQFMQMNPFQQPVSQRLQHAMSLPSTTFPSSSTEARTPAQAPAPSLAPALDAGKNETKPTLSMPPTLIYPPGLQQMMYPAFTFGPGGMQFPRSPYGFMSGVPLSLHQGLHPQHRGPSVDSPRGTFAPPFSHAQQQPPNEPQQTQARPISSTPKHHPSPQLPHSASPKGSNPFGRGMEPRLPQPQDHGPKASKPSDVSAMVAQHFEKSGVPFPPTSPHRHPTSPVTSMFQHRPGLLGGGFTQQMFRPESAGQAFSHMQGQQISQSLVRPPYYLPPDQLQMRQQAKSSDGQPAKADHPLHQTPAGFNHPGVQRASPQHLQHQPMVFHPSQPVHHIQQPGHYQQPAAHHAPQAVPQHLQPQHTAGHHQPAAPHQQAPPLLHHPQQQPSHQQPSHQQSSHQQPTHQQPTHQQPSHQQPSHQQSSHQQPTHHQPPQQQLPHQQPPHQQPPHQQPPHQQPPHQQPSHQQPSHQQPSHQQPPHHPPHPQQVHHQQPRQPSTSQPYPPQRPAVQEPSHQQPAPQRQSNQQQQAHQPPERLPAHQPAYRPPSAPEQPVVPQSSGDNQGKEAQASLEHIFQRYPVVWQGKVAIKTDFAAVQIHFVCGNANLAHGGLPKTVEDQSGLCVLRIERRMRLNPDQLDSLSGRMESENDFCMLLALPCGRDTDDIVRQTNALSKGFIDYLKQKQVAGIADKPGAGVLHILAPSNFTSQHLHERAPDLLSNVADIHHLMIVITPPT